MDSVAITIGVGWITAGLVCLGLALPLWQGRVKRNALYGVRFAQSFASDDAWLAINRYGGRRLIVWSLPMIAAGAVACFLPLASRPGSTLACAFLPLLFIAIPLLETWHFARRYAAGR